MVYTAGQAAKAAGVSKTTISKALRTGRLSYIEKSSAGYRIDPAELHRVFPKVTGEPLAVDDREHPKVTPETGGRADLSEQVKLLREMLDDMKGERDQWREQAQRLALTGPRSGGLFGWLKRKG